MPAQPPATLPMRVDSSILAKYLGEGEPVVIVKFIGVGNSAPYDYRAKDNRAYVFRFVPALEGHILRMPLSLWQRNKGRMAHDMMDERRLPHPMVVTLEMPAAAAPPPAKAQEASEAAGAPLPGEGGASPPPGTPLTEMGATDTHSETRNVVGPSTGTTVAPAPSNETQPTDGSQHMLGDRRLFEAAYDLAEPPKRLKALAALLGVEEALLREAIGCPFSKVELVTAGWVRRKAISTATPTTAP